LAAKKYFVDLNLNKNQITEFSLENRDNNPISPVSGEIYFNSVDKKIKFYDGSSWQAVGEVAANYVVYRGTLAHNASVPASPKSGDLYIFSSAGTATNFGSPVIEVGDFIIYNGSTWDVIQKNIDLQTATETSTGLVELATQDEADAGTDSSRVITPVTLNGYRINKAIPSILLFENQTITVAGTTLTHNLNNKNISLEFYDGNEKIILSYTTPTSNTVTVKSTFELTGIKVLVIGVYI
jgi:hypothetical protein